MNLLMLDKSGRREPGRDAAEAARGETVTVEEAPLICAACGAAITYQRSSIEVDGATEHTFVNPAGIIYRVRCFSAAPGCREVGSFTEQFSWFPGFAWRYAFCAACSEHLGWAYAAAGGGGFYGLIAERIAEAS